jgi:hypothetical protein
VAFVETHVLAHQRRLDDGASQALQLTRQAGRGTTPSTSPDHTRLGEHPAHRVGRSAGRLGGGSGP